MGLHVWYIAVPMVRTVKTIVLHKDIIKKQEEETFCQEHHLEEQQQEKTQDYRDLVGIIFVRFYFVAPLSSGS